LRLQEVKERLVANTFAVVVVDITAAADDGPVWILKR
jgi:hypothetical protein